MVTQLRLKTLLSKIAGHGKTRSFWPEPLLLTIIKHRAGCQDTTGNQIHAGSAPNATNHDFIDWRRVLQKPWAGGRKSMVQSMRRAGL